MRREGNEAPRAARREGLQTAALACAKVEISRQIESATRMAKDIETRLELGRFRGKDGNPLSKEVIDQALLLPRGVLAELNELCGETSSRTKGAMGDHMSELFEK